MKAKMIALARVLLASALLIATLVLGSPAALAKDDQPDHGGAAGAVYVLTNAAAGNAVAVFHRTGNGSLTPAGTVATGGLGTGAGTGSQGALAMSENGKWLYAVNPGSDDFSVFAVRPDGIEKVNQLPSGGD